MSDPAPFAGLDAGAVAVLRQGYRNSWQQYLATLDGQASAARGWDHIVLTAASEVQARAYRAQIAARRKAGLLPRETRFTVIPDPAGRRIGSGGATLNALRPLRDSSSNADESSAVGLGRTLILHSGGDSRRLPHCSAMGKLFARVPHELPDGRASTLFDEFLVSLSGLPGQAPEGVLVASGDVLLVFDHLQLDLSRPGATGVAMETPAETGQHHGVYVAEGRSRAVARFLHKPSLATMERWEALSRRATVGVDTGLVWFDREAVQRLAALARDPYVSAEGVSLNLYGDLIAALAGAAERRSYLADESDGPLSSALVAARECIWERLRGLPFWVETLNPALFLHFGTTGEYLELLQCAGEAYAPLGWAADVASWRRATDQGAIALVNAVIASPSGSFVALDSSYDGRLTAQNGLLCGVISERESLTLPPGAVLHQLPLREAQGFVTRLYGVHDNPKQSVAEGGGFLNRSWMDWLPAHGLAPRDLWPDQDDPARWTLWDAQLYPVALDREASLEAVLWLGDEDLAAPERLEVWRKARRLSLAESHLRADIGQVIAESAAIEDLVRVRRFQTGLEEERPAAELARLLGQSPDLARRAQRVDDCLAESIDPWLPIRGYQALSVATHDRRWEARAFSSLARLVRAHTPFGATSAGRDRAACSRCRVSLPARIDFGGGWTDTPPYSLERGGAVLNAAILLDGQPPIVAEAELLDRPVLELASRDLETVVRPRLAGEVLDYANPADLFALLKAALVFRGIIPGEARHDIEVSALLQAWGRGLRLTTATHIPRGSGLGTSSILAGAVLACLGGLTGHVVPEERLFDEVLCLEQMITTGGGWQDQVGGLAPGIKLATSLPGLPQQVHVVPLVVSPALEEALAERLMLVYTGQRRLAKDILRSVMGRWMSRDPEMVRYMERIAVLAHQMRDALLAVDLDAFGEMLSEHWAVLKAMDPGCTNPFIDDLWETLRPYIVGGKLAGAGGGGYAFMILRDPAPEVRSVLARALNERYTSAAVQPWPCSIAYSSAGRELRW